MKAKDIEVALYQYLIKKSKLICPNVMFYGYEMDICQVTPVGYIHEYEIKLTRSDFLADFRKFKHRVFRGEVRDEIPFRFSFVTPPGLLTSKDIPTYAGWFECYLPYHTNGPEDLSIRCLKSPPRLKWAKHLNPYEYRKLLSKMSCRYWDMRFSILQLNKKLQQAKVT